MPTDTKRWDSVDKAVEAAKSARDQIADLTNRTERTDEDNAALTAAKSLIEDATVYVGAERAGETIDAYERAENGFDFSAFTAAVTSTKDDEPGIAEKAADAAVEALKSYDGGNKILVTEKVKDLNVVTADSAGVFTRPELVSGDPTGARDTLAVADLFTWVPTEESSVEYPVLKTHTDNSEWRVEYDEGTTSFPRTADSEFKWDLETLNLKDVAAGIPMSRRASRTEALTYAKQLLSYDLRYKVDRGLINGDGTGKTIVGVSNTAGVTTLAHVAGLNEFDMISLGLQVNEGTEDEADGIVLHPEDWHKMRVAREGYTTVDPDGTPDSGDEFEQGSGSYLLGGPAAGGSTVNIWGKRIALSRAVAKGTAVIGQFSGPASRVYFNEDIAILLGDQFEDYQARGRALYLSAHIDGVGLAVVKPRAFHIVEIRS